MWIFSVPAMNIWPPALLQAFSSKKLRHVTVDHKFHITCLVRNYGIFLQCRVIQKLKAFLHCFLSRCHLFRRKSAEWGLHG